MKRILLSCALIVLGLAPAAMARGNKEKLATPIYEDQTNRTEFFSTVVGTVSTVKVHTPKPYSSARDERHLRIENAAVSANLHITTYTATNTSNVFLASNTVNSFIITPGNYLDLSPKTTYYAIWEVGNSSYPVRKQVDFHDPSGDN